MKQRVIILSQGTICAVEGEIIDKAGRENGFIYRQSVNDYRRNRFFR